MSDDPKEAQPTIMQLRQQVYISIQQNMLADLDLQDELLQTQTQTATQLNKALEAADFAKLDDRETLIYGTMMAEMVLHTSVSQAFYLASQGCETVEDWQVLLDVIEQDDDEEQDSTEEDEDEQDSTEEDESSSAS